MTQPIGNLLAPTACEDTLQQGADNFNKHIGCTTQDDHSQYLKTCSVRRLEIDYVRLSTANAPRPSAVGSYPTLAFTTEQADIVHGLFEIPSAMHVERESYLFAILAPGTASTEAIISVLSYLNTCHAAGDASAGLTSTTNTVCTTGSNALSTAASKLAEIKVATFTSGTFYQHAKAVFTWKRNSCSTAAGDAHAGNIHLVSFQLQYYDRRYSTST